MRGILRCAFGGRRRVLPVLALVAAAGVWPVVCRAGESAPAVGYLRSRYSSFSTLLIPAQPKAHPDGKSGVLSVKGTDGRAPVPPGQYYISDWMVEGDDAQGHHWYAKGNMLPDPVTIRAGEETRVRIADPLQAHLIVYGQQDPIGLRLELTGPYGERCREIRMDDHYIPHPKLDILDEQGHLVDRITFQGRCGGTCLTIWPAPPGLKGRFTALPNADLGPFPVEVGAGLSFTLDASRFSLPKARVGELAPEFNLIASDATMTQLSFMRGKPVVLSFFCSCPQCHAVAAELAKRKDLAKRVRLLAVFSDPAYAEPDTVSAFVKETGYPGKLLLDLGATVTLQYQSPECPRLWVIDAEGIVRHATPDHSASAAQIVDEALKAIGGK